jgi:hypothetical protein
MSVERTHVRLVSADSREPVVALERRELKKELCCALTNELLPRNHSLFPVQLCSGILPTPHDDRKKQKQDEQKDNRVHEPFSSPYLILGRVTDPALQVAIGVPIWKKARDRPIV